MNQSHDCPRILAQSEAGRGPRIGKGDKPYSKAASAPMLTCSHLTHQRTSRLETSSVEILVCILYHIFPPSYGTIGLEMEGSHSTTTTNLAAEKMMMVMVNGVTKERRTRARRPKVKTGCSVCKIRRVKCDETKPSCLRCIKFGMQCEGYPKLPSPNSRSIERPLLPKNEAAREPLALSSQSTTNTEPLKIIRTQSGSNPRREKAIRPSPLRPSSPSKPPSIIPKTELSPTLASSPFVPRFQNTAESRYFSLFHAQTALHLSGFYSPNLWSHIVLQASEAEPSIRHAVISIGALEMTTSSLRRVGRESTVGGMGAGSCARMLAARQQVRKETEEHHLFALQQYSKAIREMQKLILRHDRDCRTALIASLLIICFETYHGNYEDAAKQIATGIRLIESRNEMASKPIDIEEEILHAFNRLDIQSMGHTDPFTLAEHLVLKDSSAAVVSRMPTLFPSALVARNYFNIVVRRAAHFGCALWQSSHQTSDTDSLIRPTLSHFEASENAPASLVSEKQKYLDELEAWSRAFQPLFDKARPGTNDYLATRHLQMHYFPVHLTITMYPSTSELAYDNYLWMFREIIEMARIQLTCSTHDPMFAFDMQNVWPLFVVAKKCRDPVVRREAVRLLIEWPRREGIWDSVVAAAISKWVVSIEEEGMVADFVEERKRARSVGVRLDAERGRAEVWCFVTDEGGETRKRETVIEWEAKV